MKRVFKLGFSFLLLYYATIIFGSFLATKSPQKLEPADVIVVHGAGGIENELMEPSIRRTEKAVEAYNAGLAPLIVFTGAADDVGTRSVADMMAEIAKRAGVPDEGILIEERSFSTIANLQGAKILLNGFPERVILISNGFHLPRCYLIAKRLGARNVQVLSTDRIYHPIFPNGVYIVLREGLAWPWNLMRLWQLS